MQQAGGLGAEGPQVPMSQRRRGGAAEDDVADVDEMTTKYLEFQKCFQKRLEKAEMGLWDELLQEYTHELASTQSNGEGVPTRGRDEDGGEEDLWRRVQGAKSLLEGKVAAPPTAATKRRKRT